MARRALPFALGLAALACLGLPALALEGWHADRDDGLEAAEKSGRPVLVVTLWKKGL